MNFFSTRLGIVSMSYSLITAQFLVSDRVEKCAVDDLVTVSFGARGGLEWEIVLLALGKESGCEFPAGMDS